MQVKSDADSSIERARIDADAKVRVAEIQNNNDAAIQALENSLSDLNRRLEEAMASMQDMEGSKKEAEKDKPEPVAPPAQPMNLTVAVSVDAKKDETKKTITIKTDAEGNITGADVTPEENPEKGAE